MWNTYNLKVGDRVVDQSTGVRGRITAMKVMAVWLDVHGRSYLTIITGLTPEQGGENV